MPEQHLYLTIRGRYGTPTLAQETWQTGIRLAGVFGAVDDFGTLPSNWSVQAVTEERVLANGGVSTNYLINGPAGAGFSPDDWLEDVAGPAVSTLFAHNWIPDNVMVEELRLHPLYAGLDKKGNPAALTLETDAGKCVARRWWTSGNPMGTSTGNILPPQNAVVCSLRTNRLGPRGRGRCYFPAPGVGQVSVDGTYTQSAALATAFSAFLIDLADPAPGQDQRTDPIVTGKPYKTYARVVRVEVGDRIDTQRRRRRSLRETYTGRTV